MSHIERIAEEQKYICCYCEHRMFRHRHRPGYPTPRDAITKDHLIPRVYDGPTIQENLVAACCQCNNLRGEMDAAAFQNILFKWFKRDPWLWIRWHTISTDELQELKLACLHIHERQLRGLARHYVDIAYRHLEFTYRERGRLTRA